MRKIFVLIILVFSFSAFSQGVEIEEVDSVALFNYYKEIDEVVAEMREKKIEIDINNEKYHSGKAKLRTGIILTSTSVALAPITSLLGVASLMGDGDNMFFVTSAVLWTANVAAFTVGVPMIIVGARQKRKYKPLMAISPNSVNLVVEF